MRPIHSVAFSAFIIGTAGIASRILGLIRDRILASSFGAGDVLDAYYAAFRIPDTMYGLLVAGALSAALVPIFTQTLTEKGETVSWRLISDFLTVLFEVLVILIGLAFIFTPTLLDFLVPGFSGEKMDLTLGLTRVLLLSPLFFGVSAVLGGVLVSQKQFLSYSLAPLLYNLGIIGGIVFGVPHFGAIALGYGVVIGAALHMALQWHVVARSGFRYRPRLASAWKNTLVRRVIRLMIPRSLGMAMSQVSLLLIAFFASSLDSGSLSIFTFAINLQTVPLGLFGVAFSLAVFPLLARFAAEDRLTDFFRILSLTFRRILFFVLPVSVLFLVLRSQIVRIVLGGGQFDWRDTTLTFEVFGILIVSLFAQSLVQLFSRAFFALQDTRTPLLIAVASEAVQIVLLVILVPTWHLFALAIAFSVSSVVNFSLLYAALRHRLRPVWHERSIVTPAFKIILASLGAGVAGQMTKTWFGLNLSPLDTFAGVFLQAGVTASAVTVVFLLLGHWMRIEEFEQLQRFIRNKILGHPDTLSTGETHGQFFG